MAHLWRGIIIKKSGKYEIHMKHNYDLVNDTYMTLIVLFFIFWGPVPTGPKMLLARFRDRPGAQGRARARRHFGPGLGPRLQHMKTKMCVHVCFVYGCIFVQIYI